MNEHLYKPFEEELNKLRYRLIRMGTLVQQQSEFTYTSLTENNLELARQVLELEIKVNKLDIKIDKQCLRIFALHQPVAMDLRLVLSAVSMNDNMELIGDMTSNVAESILKMKHIPGLVAKTKLPELGRHVVLIVTKLMDSFVNMNKELAIEAINMDKLSNELSNQSFDILTEIMNQDNSVIETSAHLIDINRNMQSISRQTKSIAEELVFLFEAKIIKHQYLDDTFDENPEPDSESN